MKKIFSIPYYPGLSAADIDSVFIPFLKRNSQSILDFYFTCRVPPFMQDAMGTLWEWEDSLNLIKNALYIQEQSGVIASAVFNNIHISPSYENYCMFCHNFKDLYANGIRSITLPFTSWLKFGFKDLYPGVFVKNTVLWCIDKPSQLYKSLEAGFDLINLDRNLIRNFTALKELHSCRRLYEGRFSKQVKLSLLFNENCLGECPLQKEHYTYNVNNTFGVQELTWFNSNMSTVACKKSDCNSVSLLKTANIPGYYSYIRDILEYVDVFKLHGREDISAFKQSMYIVDRYTTGEPIVADPFKRVFTEHGIKSAGVSEWLNYIKNCRFNCFKCNYCDNLITKGEK